MKSFAFRKLLCKMKTAKIVSRINPLKQRKSFTLGNFIDVENCLKSYEQKKKPDRTDETICGKETVIQGVPAAVPLDPQNQKGGGAPNDLKN